MATLLLALRFFLVFLAPSSRFFGRWYFTHWRSSCRSWPVVSRAVTLYSASPSRSVVAPALLAVTLRLSKLYSHFLTGSDIPETSVFKQTQKFRDRRPRVQTPSIVTSVEVDRSIHQCSGDTPFRRGYPQV